jgi:2-polyprenyl-6-hydroxyphenyl methylase/3-demethylubiquinone-9 3-methyltransferase
MLRKFIQWQIAIGRRFDSWLPQSWRLNGQADFQNDVVPPHLTRGMSICDVGGGKRPYITAEMKNRLDLRTIGLDIDQHELDSAPEGSYTSSLCADIATYRGHHDMDLVICQAVLEHVPKARLALQSIRSMLRPGGTALIYLPCRNALFARLNLLLPEKLKRTLLFTLFPASAKVCGFPSYYDRCTPAEIARLASQEQLLVQETRAYFYSQYFMPFFPFHLLWRAWSVLSRAVIGNEAAESFTIILKCPDETAGHTC